MIHHIQYNTSFIPRNFEINTYRKTLYRSGCCSTRPSFFIVRYSSFSRLQTASDSREVRAQSDALLHREYNPAMKTQVSLARLRALAYRSLRVSESGTSGRPYLATLTCEAPFSLCVSESGTSGPSYLHTAKIRPLSRIFTVYRRLP